MQCLEILLRVLEAEWDKVDVLYAEPWTEPWALNSGLRDDFEIYAVEKGSGVIRLGAAEYRVSEGCAFVLYSLDGNAFIPDSNCGFRMGLVTFSLSGSPEFNKLKLELIESIRSTGMPAGFSNNDELLSILYSMNKEMLMRSEGYMFRLKVQLAGLVMEMKEGLDQEPVGNGTRAVNKYSRKAVDYIAGFLYDNAGSDISLEQIAGAVNLDKRYICSLYRRYTGKTVMAHLEEIRISRAQRLLTHTSLSVTQISQDTGFSSSQYFSRVFRQVTGMTPVNYRKCGR